MLACHDLCWWCKVIGSKCSFFLKMMSPFVCRKWHLQPIMLPTTGPFRHLIKVTKKYFYPYRFILAPVVWLHICCWLGIFVSCVIVWFLYHYSGSLREIPLGLLFWLVKVIWCLLIVLFYSLKLTWLELFCSDNHRNQKYSSEAHLSAACGREGQ